MPYHIQWKRKKYDFQSYQICYSWKSTMEFLRTITTPAKLKFIRITYKRNGA